MFTGLIEAIGLVKFISTEGKNKTFLIQSAISNELAVDQSVSHNGVCLTVTAVQENTHSVTAIEETLHRSTLDNIKVGDTLNLERCILPTQRLDGHIVQGHVDSMGEIIHLADANGSTLISIKIPPRYAPLIIVKGSIAIDGISLTIVSCTQDSFSVAIIPHTLEMTTIGNKKVGDYVNLEYDIIGKYFSRYKELFGKSE